MSKPKFISFISAAISLMLLSGIAGCDHQETGNPQSNLVTIYDNELYLSGGNIAWVNFADDIGPGQTDLEMFENVFRDVNEHGGNTLRFWLHTNGAHTPEWDGNEVTGPGKNTISDLKNILDLAQEYDVMLILCLWSFDMLRESFGEEVTGRARAILTDEMYMQKYFENSLSPIVEELKGHPAIGSWEIFNEPEGMSEEFGWDEIVHPEDQVPMADIQKFVNRSVAVIREIDPDVPVTTSAWSFFSLSDYFTGKNLDALPPLNELEAMELEDVQEILHDLDFNYDLDDTEVFLDQYDEFFDAKNYYTDDRLIQKGGEQTGVLDYYTVHYYDWAGTILSPFHYDIDHWGLDKPTAVTEFSSQDTFGYKHDELFTTLYDNGYGGGLGWQWIDYINDREGWKHNWPNTRDNMEAMYERYAEIISISLD